jgi:hypothetical protein
MMDSKLASKASNLPLASCKDLRRYDTQPLKLGNSCRDFAVHFLKLIISFFVPVVANSSSKYPCCVEIRVPSETDGKVRREMDESGDGDKETNEIRMALDKVSIKPFRV